jgi:hypothetical protein
VHGCAVLSFGYRKDHLALLLQYKRFGTVLATCTSAWMILSKADTVPGTCPVVQSKRLAIAILLYK